MSAYRSKQQGMRVATRSQLWLAEVEPDGTANTDHQEEEATLIGKTKHTVQEVVQRFREKYFALTQLIGQELAILFSIADCKTEALGGKLEKCSECGATRITYNACHNRCCPNCQAMERMAWIEERLSKMLPIGHLQVVFTLPSQLRELAFYNKRQIPYKILFEAAAEALRSLADEQLGVRLGITLIVHTWSREMIFHPHVHAIVTCGGLSRDGQRWVPCAAEELFPRAVLLARFRHIFMSKLARLGELDMLETKGVAGWSTDAEVLTTTMKLQAMDWVGHVEAPLGDVAALTKYLGQYTNRMVISDSRILAVDDETVTIATKEGKTLTLPGVEFLRRFLLHIPPARASRIRHYGLYSCRHAKTLLATARQLVAPDAPPPVSHRRETWEQRLLRVRGVDPLLCPVCGKGRMQLVEYLEDQWSRAAAAAAS
jgi:hypothetical protein